MKRSLRLARIAITAALYIALSLAIMPLTYGLIQVRFAEALVLLCFYNRDYCYSMVLGCIVVNAFSPLGIIDVLFGTIGTVLTVIMIRYTRRIYLAWIPAVLCTFMVALEFYITASEPFWLSWSTIAAGEFIAVALVGVPVFMLLNKNNNFVEIVGADKRFCDIMASIEEKKALRKNKHNNIPDNTIDSDKNDII